MHDPLAAARSANTPRETGLTVDIELDARRRALGMAEFTDADLDPVRRLTPGDRLLLRDRDRHLHEAVIEAVRPGGSHTLYRARFPR